MNAGRIGGLSFIWPGIWVKRLERGPDGEWRLYDLEVTTALELRDLSPAFLGVDVEAAGIFSAGSAIGASIVGAVGGATVVEVAMRQTEEVVTDQVVGDMAVGLISGATAVASMHVAREAAAAAEGLTPVLLIALTSDRIVLLDWHGSAASGTGPTRELISFPRATTQMTFGRVGATRKVTFDDGVKTTSITGALGWLTSGMEGKRDVLRGLGSTDC